MYEMKFNRILETGMGAIMSGILNFSSMHFLRVVLTVQSVLFGWAGAFAVAVAVNYLFPIMSWCQAMTKNITNQRMEYIVRIFIFSFFQTLFNSVWCFFYTGFINQWYHFFLPLLVIATIVIFAAMPIMTRVAKAITSQV